MTEKATAHDIAELVTAERRAGRPVAEPVALHLYKSGKTVDEVKVALLEERVRRKDIEETCEARGVPEVKAELLASGQPLDQALSRIGEAVTIKASVMLAAEDVVPMDKAEANAMAADFITRRVNPQHVAKAIFELAASRDEATAIIGTVPQQRFVSGRDASVASMRKILKSKGITPKE